MSPVSPIFHIASTVNNWSQTCFWTTTCSPELRCPCPLPSHGKTLFHFKPQCKLLFVTKILAWIGGPLGGLRPRRHLPWLKRHACSALLVFSNRNKKPKNWWNFLQSQKVFQSREIVKVFYEKKERERKIFVDKKAETRTCSSKVARRVSSKYLVFQVFSSFFLITRHFLVYSDFYGLVSYSPSSSRRNLDWPTLASHISWIPEGSKDP